MRGYQRAMTTYTVHLPPNMAKAASQDARMIADAPALLALVFPALWLLWHRLWFALIAYLMIAGIVSLIARLLGVDALDGLMLLPGLYLFLEGRQLLRARLERKGWRLAGVVEAANAEEADIRWFSGETEAAAPPKPPVIASASPVPPPTTGTEPSIGIFGQ